jgi:UDP-glucose 4-epimerase
LRLFNVYGPRQDPKSPYSGVISIFCHRIARGMPVAIFGDGQQTRDFIYVSDVVAALLAGMALQPADSLVFNVCTCVPTSVAALARLIAALCGTTLDMRTQPPRAGEIRHSLGTAALADRILGLPERVKLPDGLAEVLAWITATDR